MPVKASSEALKVEEIYKILEEVRHKGPVVHNITNYVAMTLSANVLLSLRAVPIITSEEREMEDCANNASSLVVNIGTPTPSILSGIRRAVIAYNSLKKPWVLDPVAVGATEFRNELCADLVGMSPAVIRGNANEIQGFANILSTKQEKIRSGSDVYTYSRIDPFSVIEIAKQLARSCGAIVALTGNADYITDGESVVSIEGGGSHLMTVSTGIGCSLSAVIAAFTSVVSPFNAAISVCSIYRAAGYLASISASGPGDFPAHLCNAIYNMTKEHISSNIYLVTL